MNTPEPIQEPFTQKYWDELTLEALEMLRRIMNVTGDQDLKFRVASAILEITMVDKETF